MFHQSSLNSEDEGECRRLGWSCVCVCVSGASSTRATAARAVRWPLIKSVWAEFLCADETLVRQTLSAWHCDCVDVPSLDFTCASHSLHRIIWNAEEGLSVWKLTLTNSTVFVTFFFYSFVLFYFFTALWPINWTLNTPWHNNDKPVYTLRKWPWKFWCRIWCHLLFHTIFILLLFPTNFNL